jgi:hypothetical protein
MCVYSIRVKFYIKHYKNYKNIAMAYKILFRILFWELKLSNDRVLYNSEAKLYR